MMLLLLVCRMTHVLLKQTIHIGLLSSAAVGRHAQVNVIVSRCGSRCVGLGIVDHNLDLHVLEKLKHRECNCNVRERLCNVGQVMNEGI